MSAASTPEKTNSIERCQKGLSTGHCNRNAKKRGKMHGKGHKGRTRGTRAEQQKHKEHGCQLAVSLSLRPRLRFPRERRGGGLESTSAVRTASGTGTNGCNNGEVGGVSWCMSAVVGTDGVGWEALDERVTGGCGTRVKTGSGCPGRCVNLRGPMPRTRWSLGVSTMMSDPSSRRVVCQSVEMSIHRALGAMLRR